MKKFTLIAVTALAMSALTSCGTMGGASKNSGTTTTTDILGAILTGGNSGSSTTQSTQSSQSSGSQSLLGSLLSGLIGNAVPVTVNNIAGTWTYSSPECRFTSENALAQAGGAVAANTVEGKLAEVYQSLGIKPGACSFTFNKDQTCSVTFGGRTISGTFTLNSDTREITIMSNTGILKLSGQVYYSVTTLSILFDASKLLSTVKMIATFTGKGSSAIGTLSSLLNNYEGMLIGMNLTK